MRADQEILLATKGLKKLYPEQFRKISYRDELQRHTLVFLTNNFTLPAETIAALYKARWEIELFSTVRLVLAFNLASQVRALALAHRLP